MRRFAHLLAGLLIAVPLQRALWGRQPQRLLPARVHNELQLGGLRPGWNTLQDALRRFGPHWYHPTPNETGIYEWNDPRRHWLLRLEVGGGDVIQAITIEQTPARAAPPAATRLPASADRTGLGIELGDRRQALLDRYGRPFFEGPSVLDGQRVALVVFNFSWAGSDKPQILESSFDPAGRLIKMTLTAEYY